MKNVCQKISKKIDITWQRRIRTSIVDCGLRGQLKYVNLYKCCISKSKLYVTP